jgi:uncharacterized damage-inducible protein DinB
MNSVSVLLAHTAGSIRWWTGNVALDEPSDRNRQSEFETRDVSGAEMLRRLDAVIEYARSALTRLSLEDLDQPRFVGEGRTVTCGWALLHALEHGYLHLGHIQLTCQLWRQR